MYRLYPSAGVFPIDVTIHAPDGRTAYLNSNAEVSSAGSPTIYQIAQGWNLLGPQLPAGVTIQASTVAAQILSVSQGKLVAIYGLSGSRWSPSYIDARGHAPTTPDFSLQAGQGYLVYSDRAAAFTLGPADLRR